MIINYNSYKGGVGKTTLATNTALALDAAILDLDGLRSSSKFNQIRTANGHKPLQVLTAKTQEELKGIIKEFQGDRILIVDSAGVDSDINRLAALSSDMLIVPTSPSVVEVLALTEYSEFLRKTGEEYEKDGDSKSNDNSSDKSGSGSGDGTTEGTGSQGDSGTSDGTGASQGSNASDTSGNADLQEAMDKVSKEMQSVSEGMYDKVSNLTDQYNLGDYVELSMDPDYQYVQISLRGSILFDSGKADIMEEAKPILSKIGGVLQKFDGCIIEIVGHTDNVPMTSSAYKDNNWLSTARALNAAEYLIKVQKLDPVKIKYSGRGEYEPVASNATPEGRAKNRMIEIRIYNELSKK
jgi:chemotaxis protein MotB